MQGELPRVRPPPQHVPPALGGGAAALAGALQEVRCLLAWLRLGPVVVIGPPVQDRRTNDQSVARNPPQLDCNSNDWGKTVLLRSAWIIGNSDR